MMGDALRTRAQVPKKRQVKIFWAEEKRCNKKKRKQNNKRKRGKRSGASRQNQGIRSRILRGWRKAREGEPGAVKKRVVRKKRKECRLCTEREAEKKKVGMAGGKTGGGERMFVNKSGRKRAETSGGFILNGAPGRWGVEKTGKKATRRGDGSLGEENRELNLALECSRMGVGRIEKILGDGEVEARRTKIVGKKVTRSGKSTPLEFTNW